MLKQQNFAFFLLLRNSNFRFQAFFVKIIKIFSRKALFKSILLPALYQAKDRLEAISEAESKQILAEDIVKYSHKISACNATCAPTGWQPGDPRRPYPTDVDMRAGILPQITNNGFIQQNNQDIPRPPAQLGTDGLATLMKDNTMQTQIGSTWNHRTPKPEDSNPLRPGTSPAIHQPCSSPTGSSSSSSDSSIGD